MKASAGVEDVGEIAGVQVPIREAPQSVCPAVVLGQGRGGFKCVAVLDFGVANRDGRRDR